MAVCKIVLLSVLALASLAHAARFDVINRCTYTVWAAALPNRGGRRLDPGQTWVLDFPTGTEAARIWGRTGCNFNAAGQGGCNTGDCGGRLECTIAGRPPTTLAEFTLKQQDSLDISVIDGYNVPMEFSPTNGGCQGRRCADDSIIRDCPAPLRTNGGCNSACQVFGGVQYCCSLVRGSCQPTEYSRFFKTRCPGAYSYAQDDQSSIFTCPSGTNYRVVFCP